MCYVKSLPHLQSQPDSAAPQPKTEATVKSSVPLTLTQEELNKQQQDLFNFLDFDFNATSPTSSQSQSLSDLTAFYIPSSTLPVSATTPLVVPSSTGPVLAQQIKTQNQSQTQPQVQAALADQNSLLSPNTTDFNVDLNSWLSSLMFPSPPANNSSTSTNNSYNHQTLSLDSTPSNSAVNTPSFGLSFVPSSGMSIDVPLFTLPSVPFNKDNSNNMYFNQQQQQQQQQQLPFQAQQQVEQQKDGIEKPVGPIPTTTDSKKRKRVAGGKANTISNKSCSDSDSSSSPSSVETLNDADSGDMDPANIRRLKNTEAARKSRAKKAMLMEDLQQANTVLHNENASLKVANTVLVNEKNAVVSREKDLLSRIESLERQLAESHAVVMKMVSQRK
jgi:hypothetical protein